VLWLLCPYRIISLGHKQGRVGPPQCNFQGQLHVSESVSVVTDVSNDLSVFVFRFEQVHKISFDRPTDTTQHITRLESSTPIGEHQTLQVCAGLMITCLRAGTAHSVWWLGYVRDEPRFESRREKEISHSPKTVRAGSGTQPGSCTVGTVGVAWRWSDR